MQLHDLFEIFDSRLDVEWKDVLGGGAAAGFKVGDVNYVVQLMPGPVLVRNLKVLEVSFFIYAVKGDEAFKSSGASTNPTAVYGVVANALIDRLPTENCDAVFFSAERRHATDEEQHKAKVRLYAFAAKQIAKKLGWQLYEDDNEFLLTKEYQGPAVSTFKHWQERVKEALQHQSFPSIIR